MVSVLRGAGLTRVAFTLIGGKDWTGGRNYLLNLLQALASHQQGAVTPVLFTASGSKPSLGEFACLPGVEIVESRLFDARGRKARLLQSLVWGRVPALTRLFAQQRIDVVFEAAQFFGWRLGIPVVAWIPDFQHRALPHLFSRMAWWKREIGFRAQILGGRAVMLSSEDARRACEHCYPATLGCTQVVHFAIQPRPAVDGRAARAIADSYGLPEHFVFMPNQFWRHKNHLLVLEALRILRERGSNVIVAASGAQHDPRDAAYFQAFKRALEGSGLEGSLRLLGLISYEHLRALMCCCQALLNPSLFEGWSTTVEEARALSVPMLLSDLDVHREQMGAKARYFQRDSAQALADVLEQAPPFDAPARAAALDAAHTDAQARARGFAGDFARLMASMARARSS